MALEQLTPEAPKTKETIDWLMAHRTGHRWSPEKATGPADAGARAWFARTRFDGEHYKLTVFVNDYEAKVLDVDADTGTLTVDVPRRFLKTGKQARSTSNSPAAGGTRSKRCWAASSPPTN